MRNKRLNMGEENWLEYQKQRNRDKAKSWKARNVEKVVDWRRRTKQKLIEYKGGGCQKCGYNKDCPSAYDFHHRNPSEKSFGIGAKGITRNFEDLKKEVDKCDLLCCRCHAELHEEEYKEQRQETKERHKAWIESRCLQKELKQDRNCQYCNNKFTPKRKEQIYCCKPCHNFSMKKNS
jgi:hypothetical protein